MAMPSITVLSPFTNLSASWHGLSKLFAHAVNINVGFGFDAQFYGRSIGQAIIFYSSGFWLLLLFILAYSQRPQIGCQPYFHTRCGLRVNFECRSEMCYMQLVENTGSKNSPKIRYLRTITQLCRAISSHIRCISTIGKKLLNSNISSTCPHKMVNFGPQRSVRLAGLGHRSKWHTFNSSLYQWIAKAI